MQARPRSRAGHRQRRPAPGPRCSRPRLTVTIPGPKMTGCVGTAPRRGGVLVKPSPRRGDGRRSLMGEPRRAASQPCRLAPPHVFRPKVRSAFAGSPGRSLLPPTPTPGGSPLGLKGEAGVTTMQQDIQCRAKRTMGIRGSVSDATGARTTQHQSESQQYAEAADAEPDSATSSDGRAAA